MNIKLIIKGREETDISECAKKWFYKKVLNGESGPFTCESFNNKTKAILLIEPKNPNQKELF